LNRVPGESVDLIYADPPFFSNQRYEMLGAEDREIRAFDDRWEGGIQGYIAWMEPRLRMCHKVLKSNGSMYLHCDWHAGHYLKVLMDQVFGADCFQREIIWKIGWVSGFKSRAKNYIRNHDTLFLYTKSHEFTFNKVFLPHPKGYERRGGGGNPRGVALDDVWLDIHSIQHLSFSKEKLGYPTQKPEALLGRLIRVSSDKGDLVLDPFCGSGTTLAAARKLGRRWIGIDVSPAACRLATKRMGAIGGREGPEAAGMDRTAGSGE
jgi:DNA modification methylase